MRVVALEEHFTVPALASKYVKPEAVAKRGHYKGRKVAPGKTSPMELLIDAVTGGRPTARRAGKVTRVPEPTTALMPPAAKPAAATASISHPVMRTSPTSLARRPA